MFDVHRHAWFAKAVGPLASLAILRSFAFAFFDTVFSVFLLSFLGSDALVGGFSAAFTLLIAAAFVFSASIVARFDEASLWKRSTIAIMLGFLLFSIAPSIWAVIAISLAWIIAYSIEFQTATLLIRDGSSDDAIGSTQALTYVLKNVAYLAGPLLAGFVLEALGARAVFVFAAGFSVLALLHFRTQSWPQVEHEMSELSPLRGFRQYFQDTERVRAYIMNAGLALYWGIIYTFVPLYVIHSGHGEAWIGILFFSVTLPLVLFGYATGPWADAGKYKQLFSIGYATLALFTVLAFLDLSIWWVAACLFLAGCAAWLLAGTRDAYFFSVTDQRQEERYIGTFMTARGIGSTTGKLAVAAVLLVLPFNFFFLTAALFMGAFSLYALRLSTGTSRA